MSYISREAAIKAIEDLHDCYNGFSDTYDKACIIGVLEELPSADVVEVVRCKDCRFHKDEQPGMVYCPAAVGGWVEDDWFCKGGERRTDGEIH